MNKEHETKLQILRDARDLSENRGLGYRNNPVANEIARELIYEGLVIGSVSEHGNSCITGIREAGIKYLEDQKPHRKALAVSIKFLFVLYSISLLSVGYILNLDSVKSFFSDLFEGVLK